MRLFFSVFNRDHCVFFCCWSLVSNGFLGVSWRLQPQMLKATNPYCIRHISIICNIYYIHILETCWMYDIYSYLFPMNPLWMLGYLKISTNYWQHKLPIFDAKGCFPIWMDKIFAFPILMDKSSISCRTGSPWFPVLCRWWRKPVMRIS